MTDDAAQEAIILASEEFEATMRDIEKRLAALLEREDKILSTDKLDSLRKKLGLTHG